MADEEFVSQDQSVTVMNILESLLKVRPISTETFEQHMWDSVFWNEDNARPDRITQSMNELYEKSNEKVQEIIKKEMQTEESSSGGGGFTYKNLVSANAEGATSSKKLTKDELDKLYELLTEKKSVVQWNGEVFTPKSMTLSRVNLATLKSNSSTSSVQVSVSQTSSELRTGINTLDSSSSVLTLMQQRNELLQMKREMR